MLRRLHGLEVAWASALCPAIIEILYANLESLHTSYNYFASHIWNCDESSVQVGRCGATLVLAKRDYKSIHSIELDQRKHQSILSCVNANGGCIPNFYISKGSYFLEDYIARCDEGTIMGMQPKVWMMRWLFKSSISHFIECLRKGLGLDLTNCHVLILEGHNSHVTLEVVKMSMELGLDIVFLPSYTSHALQPLEVACCKPFNVAFRILRDGWSLTNKNKAMEKQNLHEWTSKALKVALTTSNIRVGFKRTGIWPLDRQAARVAMKPSERFEKRGCATFGGRTTGLRGGGDPGGTGSPSGIGQGNHVITGNPGDSNSDLQENFGTLMHANSCDSSFDVGLSTLGETCFTGCDLQERTLYYYVYIPDRNKSTYQPCERNLEIDPKFEA